MRRRDVRGLRCATALAFTLPIVLAQRTDAAPATVAVSVAVNLGSATADDVVLFADAASLDRGLSHMSRIGVSPSAVMEEGDPVVAVSLSPAQEQSLATVDGVVSIEPNRAFHLDGVQEGAPWNLDRIDQDTLPLDGMYAADTGGAGVSIYIVDSGIRASHSEFAGRVAAGAYIDFGDFTGVGDCNGHGTHVAGIAAGTTYGVAKQATIVPVKVAGCDGSISEANIIAGLNFVLTDHVSGPAVANLSLGGPPSDAVDTKVRELITDGVTVVVAAGNDAADTCAFSPGRVSQAITVAASEIDDSVAPYSNAGPCNDLFAPGSDVLSASNLSDSGSTLKSGTSMAAPHVAGYAARLLQNHPGVPPVDIHTVITFGASPGVLTGTCCGEPNRLLRATSDNVGVSLTMDGSGSVTSSTSDQICTATCSVIAEYGHDITLTATPADGWIFLGWSGACTGTSPCTLRPLAPGVFLTAKFLLAGGPVSFTPVAPIRVADSRTTGVTIDGLFQNFVIGPSKVPFSPISILIAGRGVIPANVVAVAMNLTVVAPSGNGFAKLFPCDAPRPSASSINFTAGTTIANAMISRVGNNMVCIELSAPTNVIIDVTGYFTAPSSYHSASPSRLVDTRAGQATIDGAYAGIGPRLAGTESKIQVAGRAGVPADATSASLNIAVVAPSGNGFLTAYPCGTTPPNASNINYVAGVTIANGAMTKLASDGSVCILTSATAHVIVDVNGYYADASEFTSLVPTRLVDSRANGTTVDGAYQAIGPRLPGTISAIQVAGRGGVPANATSVLLNLAVVSPSGNGFATVYPCGTPTPTASNINFITGRTIANSAITKLGDGGQICIVASAATNVIVDVSGYNV